MEYLKNQILENDHPVLISTAASLYEKQLKTEMLANLRQDFVLRMIDEPFIPEIRIWPRRTFLVITAMFGGGFLGIILAFLKHSIFIYVRSYRKQY